MIHNDCLTLMMILLEENILASKKRGMSIFIVICLIASDAI